MPNHVTNKLLIRGPLSRVEALLKQGRVTYTRPETRIAGQLVQPASIEEVQFSLRGFVPPPDHPDYRHGACSHIHTGRYDPHPNCWLPWNRTNWGTKWDCYDERIEQVKDTVLESMARLDGEPHGGAAIYFDTAWGPPMPVIERIVELYPELNIELTYMDEDMFGAGGGRMVFELGTLMEERDGINNKDDPEFVRIASDLKNYDPDDNE